jgi:phosphatidylglycerophosphatase A
MGAAEIILALVLLLLIFGAGVVLRPAIRTSGQVFGEFQLWVAEGFGVGRIPWAPGTFGSLVGILWLGALLASGRYWVLVLGSLAGLGVSVWLCGLAEARLARKDPGSVVLDEIAAMPICFFAWIAISMRNGSSLPYFADLFSARAWFITLGLFAAFRLFDVWKPWPVRQSQALAGGWGITVDDALAAGYVNLLVLLIYAVRALLGLG